MLKVIVDIGGVCAWTPVTDAELRQIGDTFPEDELGDALIERHSAATEGWVMIRKKKG